MSQDMLSNEAGKDALFDGRHEDAPLFAPRNVDAEQDETVTGFTYMLGDEGEEFIYEDTGTGAAHDPAGAQAVFDDAYFDVDLVLARAAGTEHVHMLDDVNIPVTGDVPANSVDLDYLFDSLNIGGAPHTNMISPIVSADEVAALGDHPGAVTVDSMGIEAIFSFENFDSIADSLLDHLPPGDQS
ncbi:MAG: hypothetical protein K9G33_15800 [Sneathiella sp.]|nr:hypothetical protein [Sneathiella sp.]